MSAILESKLEQETKLEEPKVEKPKGEQETKVESEAVKPEDGLSGLIPFEQMILKAFEKKNSVEALKYIFGAKTDWIKFAFFTAIKTNKVSEVEYLYSLPGIYMGIKNEENLSPLMVACADASPEMVKFLLSKNANLFEEDSKGFTPFLHAILKSNKEVIQFLVSEDPKILLKTTSCGRNPFMTAARRNNIALMEQILKMDKEAYKKDRTNKSTAMINAACSDSIDAMEFIANIDSDPYRPDLVGMTPFLTAAMNGSIRAMDWLLTKKPNSLLEVNKEGKNALYQAADRGQTAAVKYLLQLGIRVDYPSNFGYHAVHGAVLGNFKELAEYLKQANQLLEHVKKGNLKEIQEWADSGNTLNMRDAGGDSLLTLALNANQIEVALYLLSKKDANKWTGDYGETALQIYLIKEGMEALVKLFLKRAESLSKSVSEDEQSFAEKALYDELEALICYAEQKKIKIDYEFLALNIDKKYWCKVAKELADYKETASNVAEFSAKKEKLSHLIYTQHVICRESKESEVEFECGKGPTEAPDALVETDEERYHRLSTALKYALEARDFATAMRLCKEMSSSDATLPEIVLASEEQTKTSSKDEFVIKLMQMHYKPKYKKSEDAVVVDLLKDATLDRNTLAG